MVEPEMKTVIATAGEKKIGSSSSRQIPTSTSGSARIIRTRRGVPTEELISPPLCEFFMLDPDHPDNDGTCILRDDGCARKKAVKNCLDCWRRYSQDLQKRLRDEFKK